MLAMLSVPLNKKGFQDHGFLKKSIFKIQRLFDF